MATDSINEVLKANAIANDKLRTEREKREKLELRVQELEEELRKKEQLTEQLKIKVERLERTLLAVKTG